MAPFRIAKPRFLAYFAFEGALIFLVLYGLAKLGEALNRTEPREPLLVSAIVAGLFFVALLMTQWANLGDRESWLREIAVFSVIAFTLAVISSAAIFALDRDERFSAILFLQGAFAVPAAVALWRWFSVRYRVFSSNRENVLIVGTGETAQQVCRWIMSNHVSDYAVIGFAHEDDSREGGVLAMGVRIQTDFNALARFAPGRAERIIVALDEKRGKLPVRQLMELRLLGLEIEDATSFFERISGKIAVETMLPSWLIFSDGFKTSALRSLLKRAADVALAGLLLVLASPIMLLATLIILLESGSPVLYRQSRLGLERHEFNMLKFRSMMKDAERQSGPTWAEENDPRVTRFGRIMRTARIDELPQLFNILKGEMSFVGPRPERGHFVRRLEERIPYYGLRMTVRPGLTGWAQVEYRYSATEEDALEKLKYDLYYIKNNNLLLDLWIVLKTVRVVLRGAGAR